MLRAILRMLFVAIGVFVVFLTFFGEGQLSSGRMVQGLALGIGLIVTPFTAFAYVLVYILVVALVIGFPILGAIVGSQMFDRNLIASLIGLVVGGIAGFRLLLSNVTSRLVDSLRNLPKQDEM